MSAFISYTNTPQAILAYDQLENWYYRHQLGPGVIGWDPPQIRPRDARDVAPNPLSPNLLGADKVIFVIVPGTNAYVWIQAEINASAHKTIYWTNPTPGLAVPLPPGLSASQEVAFTAADIRNALA